MLRPVRVEALPGYRIRVRYSDGESGEIDLSHLAGKGVFKAWEEPGAYERVHIDDWGAVAWGNGIELCPDALYMELTGKSWEELSTETGAPVSNA